LKKFIHIVSDEKFINSAYIQFDSVFPKKNVFYLLVDNFEVNLKHVHFNENFTTVKQDLSDLKVLANSFQNNELVIFHGFDYYKSFVFKNLPKSCTTVWMVWGAEVYNNTEVFRSETLYGPSTWSTFFDDSHSSRYLEVIKSTLRRLFYFVKNQTEVPDKLILNAISNVDYCGVLYKEEFDFIQWRINSRIKHLKFSYYPLELLIREVSSRITDVNILLGNSASPTNNHLESFELLRYLPIEKRKIIVPLSYGNKQYASEVIDRGKELFSSNLIPLVDFMPLYEYNEYLEQCGIVIMNHYRQQALGNVLTMLWLGSKVFLDERNSIFHYLTRIGIIVFSIQKYLTRNNSEVFNMLSKEEQEINRKILQKEIGQEQLYLHLHNEFELHLSES
jgi:dTDP-N-acetylfucosamine:lipid II N-acetylfucosaminyltransferase